MEKRKRALIRTILAGITLAMGVAVIVLSYLGESDTKTLIELLAIGLICVGLRNFIDEKE